ncbi:hypothetical protein I316_07345 [Kwoniella heveanensis BCC8398]|uniref:Uncharacterized protein n=1 Tax=Kwoniella heveanensis BCC8398 TaxID=1296120 RepID=A0A1B9GJ10_9TREE|nr:hypothetical protein I316_07345 [Kwoniella heveanensis BCC8398]
MKIGHHTGGPPTPEGGVTLHAPNASKICNVLDYGAKASADNTTDISPYLTRTWKECIRSKGTGAILYIPEGTYALKTSYVHKHGGQFHWQVDGQIVAHVAGSSFGGNMIVFQDVSDFSIYSGNGKGAINGQGWVKRSAAGVQGGSRMLRFIDCNNFSLHDMLIIDSPSFHVVIDHGTNVEVANLTIRGVWTGGSDGIDISAKNFHVHDVEVSNRDECVSIKTGCANGTVERIRCNSSGAISVGSLKNGAEVENILIQDVDVYESGAFVIKTQPTVAGTRAGYVKNLLVRRFRNWRSQYTVHIDQHWQLSIPDEGAGVQLSNITFSNFRGSNDNGYARGYVVVDGSRYAVAHDIVFDDFFMYAENSYKGIGEKNVCKNVYGSGECVPAANGTTYPSGVASTIVMSAAPAGWTLPAAPTWGHDGYGMYTPIPVYSPVPTYPLDFADYGLVAQPPTNAAVLATPTISSIVHSSVTSTAASSSNTSAAAAAFTSNVESLAGSSSAESLSTVTSPASASTRGTVTRRSRL